MSTEALMKVFFKSSFVYFLLILHVYLKKKSLLSKLLVLDKGEKKNHKFFSWRASKKLQIEGELLVDFQAGCAWCLSWTLWQLRHSGRVCWVHHHHRFVPHLLPCLYAAFSSLLASPFTLRRNVHWFSPHTSHFKRQGKWKFDSTQEKPPGIEWTSYP